MRVLETNKGVVQVFIPDHANQSSAASTGSSNAISLNDAYISRLHATEDCYIKFGSSGVTASSGDMPFDAGTEVFGVPTNATHVGVIQKSTSGTLTVTAME